MRPSVDARTGSYDLAKHMLTVQATSTSASASLNALVTSSGQLIGTLTNAGGGKYQGQFSLATTPQNVTVKSSLGGSASPAVTPK